MPRAMSGAMLTALSATALYPAVFVQLTFSTGPLYIWSGTGNVVWNGHTWIGVGTFGGISVIEEGATVQARGIMLTLSGIDPTMLADALQNMQIGLPVIVYLGLYNGSSLIADPLISWSGRTDQPLIEISGTTAVISLACESRLLEMNVPADRRYTMEDNSRDNPLDLSFQFVQAIQEYTLLFGVSSISTNNL